MKDCCSPQSACCDDIPLQSASKSVALVGNPNCGKTTLFNALTGARQRVGNWPGVTVERKHGYFTEKNTTIEVIDLPGIYTLNFASDTGAVDEQIACDFILNGKADVVINIVDASHLERHLYLTLQLLEMGVPVILALNMMDVVRSHHIQIALNKLSQWLGCPVVALEANKHQGIGELKRHIVAYEKTDHVLAIPYPEVVERGISSVARNCHPRVGGDPSMLLRNSWMDSRLRGNDSGNSGNDSLRGNDSGNDSLRGNDSRERWMAARLLEDDAHVRQIVTAEVLDQVKIQQACIQQTLQEDADIVIADARYQFIQQGLQHCMSRATQKVSSWTARLDSVVLNRVLGIPIFLAVMYLLFFFSINIGGAFQDFFDISSQTIFVDGFAALLKHIGAPTWLTVLLANGIGKGINTTITFIPVIGAMFLFLALLEDSGYMARAAFVVDRFMRILGLPGKAFVPMIVGFGCNVPAVMAARTLENKRDRIITIMMSPFMSCGARLAIYTVFASAFFPQGGQNVVFALYLIGILMAVLTGFILRKTLLKGDSSPLLMELPSYHMPRVKTLLLHAWQRLKNFVFRAGKLIVPICVLIGALNSLNLDGSLNAGDGDAQSLLSMVGQWVTPIFTPMGIHADNWPATVGLVTGILAKEVVIGTLNTLYSQIGHLAASGGADFHFWAGIQEALRSIPENFAQLSSAFSNPVLAKAPIHSMDQGVYGVMYQRFDGQIGAFAYLLFVLLYFPCISTMAAMLRELHRGWAVFSALWTTGIAYGVAVLFYQAATWSRHPFASGVWIIALVSAFFGTIALVHYLADRKDASFRKAVLAGEQL